LKYNGIRITPIIFTFVWFLVVLIYSPKINNDITKTKLSMKTYPDIQQVITHSDSLQYKLSVFDSELVKLDYRMLYTLYIILAFMVIYDLFLFFINNNRKFPINLRLD
jgi:hypothetical protein